MLENEISRKCKCCGTEQPIESFDLAANRRPIHLCRKCRYAQQTIANLRNVPPENLTARQQDRLQDATDWMQICYETTGFKTGTRRPANAVDFRDTSGLLHKQEEAKKLHHQRVQFGKQMREKGQVPPLTLERLREFSGAQLAEFGYTGEDVDNLLEATPGIKAAADYDALYNKAMEVF